MLNFYFKGTKHTLPRKEIKLETENSNNHS